VARKAQAPLLVVFEARKVDDARWLASLRDVGDLRMKAFLMFSGDVPCQGIAERVTRLNVHDPERVYVARAERSKEEEAFVERLLLTLGSSGQHERILDAWWEGDTFVVANPRFHRLRVPIDRLPALRAVQHDEFRIDEDGVFVHWPRADVHLGWEQLAQAVSDILYLRARQDSRQFNRQYGAAIRRLRQAHHLTQEAIRGLTARQVGRIERGECRATSGALAKLAASHGLELPAYLERLSPGLSFK
jgi:hypothetical protein